MPNRHIAGDNIRVFTQGPGGILGDVSADIGFGVELCYGKNEKYPCDQEREQDGWAFYPAEYFGRIRVLFGAGTPVEYVWPQRNKLCIPRGEHPTLEKYALHFTGRAGQALADPASLRFRCADHKIVYYHDVLSIYESRKYESTKA